MSNYSTKPLLFLIVLPLAIGGCIYLLFRPTTLTGFSVLRKLGLFEIVESTRSWVMPSKTYFWDWVIYSLPDAFWTFSLVVFFGFVWLPLSRQAAMLAAFSATIISVSTELLQIPGVISGTFDPTDLILKLLFALFALIIISIYSRKPTIL